MNIKRVYVCTILGIIAGVICYVFAKGSPMGPTMTSKMITGIILNRALLGFVIGISGWKKINPLVHGAVIGLIVSLLMAVYANLNGAIMVLIAGVVYGIAIEYVATNLMKLKA